MNDMFGISISPFQGFGVSWLRHFTGLHPVLAYNALSGQTYYSISSAPKGHNISARWQRPSLNAKLNNHKATKWRNK